MCSNLLEGLLDILEEPVPLVLVEAGLLEAGEAGLQGHLRLLVSASIPHLTLSFFKCPTSGEKVGTAPYLLRAVRHCSHILRANRHCPLPLESS